VRELRGTALRDVDHELDAVAIDDDGRVVAIASCKWTAQPLPVSEKARLDALAAHLVPEGPPPRLYFFAREAFDAALVREAQRSDRVHLVAAADLFERG
jgi:hypothetical protein